MVSFFGILAPGSGNRQAAAEAPRKVSFFGGIPDWTVGAVPMTRAEQDACYLGGKTWEPDPLPEAPVIHQGERH